MTIVSSVTTTSTTTTATTSTMTQINTVFAPSATFLAQCDPTTNMISSAVGQKIGTVSYNPLFVLHSLYTQDQTGYGCCGKRDIPVLMSTLLSLTYLLTSSMCHNGQLYGLCSSATVCWWRMLLPPLRWTLRQPAKLRRCIPLLQHEW